MPRTVIPPMSKADTRSLTSDCIHRCLEDSRIPRDTTWVVLDDEGFRSTRTIHAAYALAGRAAPRVVCVQLCPATHRKMCRPSLRPDSGPVEVVLGDVVEYIGAFAGGALALVLDFCGAVPIAELSAAILHKTVAFMTVTEIAGSTLGAHDQREGAVVGLGQTAGLSCTHSLGYAGTPPPALRVKNRSHARPMYFWVFQRPAHGDDQVQYAPHWAEWLPCRGAYLVKWRGWAGPQAFSYEPRGFFPGL